MPRISENKILKCQEEAKTRY